MADLVLEIYNTETPFNLEVYNTITPVVIEIVEQATVHVNGGGSTSLEDLTDVEIVNPVNGQGLVYNETTGLWENSTPAGGGDMLKSVYDPTSKNADAFDMGNMSETANAKVFTNLERTKLASFTEVFTTALKNAYDGAVNWIATNGATLLNHLIRTDNPHETTWQDAIDAEPGYTYVEFPSGAFIEDDGGQFSMISIDGKIFSFGAFDVGVFKFGTSLNLAQFLDYRITKKGIEYFDDYSSGFTNRSLIDKGFVVGLLISKADIDINGKVPMSQINDALLGNVSYQGLWNAAAYTPDLTTVEAKGHYYITSDAGVRFGIDFEVGDWIISNGVTWDKVDNTDAVASVNGKKGVVTIDKADVGLPLVPNTDFTSAVALNTAKVSFDSTSSTRLANTSGNNTGDNATNSQYSGLASSKQDTLVSGTNIKTVNGNSLLGSTPIVLRQKDIYGTTTTNATVTGATNIEVSTANYFILTLTGNSTITFTGLPSAGLNTIVNLRVTGAFTITFANGTTTVNSTTYNGAKTNLYTVDIPNGVTPIIDITNRLLN